MYNRLKHIKLPVLDRVDLQKHQLSMAQPKLHETVSRHSRCEQLMNLGER